MFLVVLVGLAISENIEDNVNKKQSATMVNKKKCNSYNHHDYMHG